MARLLTLFVLMVAGLSLLTAQRSLRPTVYAIKDVRAVVIAGKAPLDKGTIVLRDGVIEDIGPSVKIPADALVIDGKGLTAYPGLVDALSSHGYDAAQRKSAASAPVDLASDALAATRPDHRKGITPDFQARTALKVDPAVEDWRRLGFTARLVAPEGGIVAGQSVLVSLSGATPRTARSRGWRCISPPPSSDRSTSC